MHNWFECKVRYEKTGEDGLPKKVTEPYLVDALSFTEAEARIIKEITPFVSGEFTVSNIRRARIAELFDNPSGDKWYRSKVNFISLDEEKGVEKKTASTMMVQAENLKDALALLIEKLSATLSDWEVVSIAETPIMDVYPYVPQPDAATSIEQE
ncbi:DUF4494 domain-containing protein [Microbacter margulisiae]|uniref:DUF4494 domain-containing protein n=1 Tax=Microbacter margulisiae TaxID=1350067 RepID=A0A7W5H158_9PORP|nr:DUF4494 domain-containing protein [Microbacter margulisiae]MBB3187233.1 hypothetical protein [Microbacter margulisiae]